MQLPEFFEYRDGQLYIEGCELSELAREYGTPLYVYSASAIKTAYERYRTAFERAGLDATICYAVKANSNIHILRMLHELGAGADVVSGGELYLARAARVTPEKIVFAGVGKTAAEIDYALRENILAFNVESAGELHLIKNRASKQGKTGVGISLRVRPEVSAGGHHYITTGAADSKFGLSFAEVHELARELKNSPTLKLRGLHVHIGSQMRGVTPILEAVRRVVGLATEIGGELEYLDIGGGVGVNYAGEPDEPNLPDALASGIAKIFRETGRTYPLLVEPGRYLVAMSGALLTEVLYLKESGETRFAVVDAGMNDLLRPALYGAVHPVVSLAEGVSNTAYKIVGPVCESGDFLSERAELPTLEAGAGLAILGAGAYGFSMASNYNSRSRPAEVLVNGNNVTLIRRRETLYSLLKEQLVNIDVEI
jgi:diaminopimelate decarboxylase